jgi:hypothetical protein
MNAATGKISKNEGILVKPQYSKVSPFCTELTSITQNMLDNEDIMLEEALDILRAEYGPYQCKNIVRAAASYCKKKCRHESGFR